MTVVAGPATAAAEQAALPDGTTLQRRRRSRGGGRRLRTAVQGTALVLWCLLPVYWMVAASIRDPGEVYDTTLWPRHLSVASFVQAFRPDDLLALGLANSALISLAATVVALLLGTFAAYALARADFPAKNLVLGVMLAISMLPGASLVTPLYNVWADLHWLYSYQSLILPYIAIALPLALYTLNSFFSGLPWELEEAARMDGCSRWQAFRIVLLPLAAPAVFTTAILTFISSWNEYVIASVLSNEKTTTVTVVIGNFAGELTGGGPTMAAGVIATLPVMVLVLVFQRRITAGLTAGSLK